jgi:hypothetical protein
MTARRRSTGRAEAIRGIRNVRSEYDVPAARRIAAHFSDAGLVADNLL